MPPQTSGDSQEQAEKDWGNVGRCLDTEAIKDWSFVSLEEFDVDDDDDEDDNNNANYNNVDDDDEVDDHDDDGNDDNDDK